MITYKNVEIHEDDYKWVQDYYGCVFDELNKQFHFNNMYVDLFSKDDFISNSFSWSLSDETVSGGNTSVNKEGRITQISLDNHIPFVLFAYGFDLFDPVIFDKLKNLNLTLNLNGLKKIETVSLQNNICISEIICDECVDLFGLWCDKNKISSLNLKNNHNLDFLSCTQNNLSEIDLSQQAKITALFCEKNPIKKIITSPKVSLDEIKRG